MDQAQRVLQVVLISNNQDVAQLNAILAAVSDIATENASLSDTPRSEVRRKPDVSRTQEQYRLLTVAARAA